MDAQLGGRVILWPSLHPNETFFQALGAAEPGGGPGRIPKHGAPSASPRLDTLRLEAANTAQRI